MSTVDKALSVLDLFSESRASIGLSEASRLLQRDKATVQRYLSVLNERGFLEQDPLTRAYHLGPAVTRLALVRDRTYPVQVSVRRRLRKLVVDTGETAHVSHFQKGGLSEVLIEETTFNGTRVYIDPAELLPLHASASGIALLSAMPFERAARLLGQSLDRYTQATPTNLEDVLHLVRLAKDRRYALMAGTFEIDVVGMAAPIFDFGNQVCGAVAVAMPVSRFNKDVEQRNHAHIIHTAHDISRLYGANLSIDETPAKPTACSGV